MNVGSAPKKLTTGERGFYAVAPHFVDWLDEGEGRGAYFGKIDPLLSPPVISKIKNGRTPIDFATAIRLERAQKQSEAPLKAPELMTFVEDRELYLYVTGQAPAPAPLKRPRRQALLESATPAMA